MSPSDTSSGSSFRLARSISSSPRRISGGMNCNPRISYTPASVADVRTRPLSTVSMPHSLTLRPLRIAYSRSFTLCSLLPVKCCSKLPKQPCGTTRRSAAMPARSHTVALVSPLRRCAHAAHRAEIVERFVRRRARADEVEIADRRLHTAQAARGDDVLRDLRALERGRDLLRERPRVAQPHALRVSRKSRKARASDSRRPWRQVAVTSRSSRRRPRVADPRSRRCRGFGTSRSRSWCRPRARAAARGWSAGTWRAALRDTCTCRCSRCRRSSARSLCRHLAVLASRLPLISSRAGVSASSRLRAARSYALILKNGSPSNSMRAAISFSRLAMSELVTCTPPRGDGMLEGDGATRPNAWGHHGDASACQRQAAGPRDPESAGREDA